MPAEEAPLSHDEPHAEQTPRNRLADETSAYLLQHADNPVHWWAWGPEAFEQARREDKPVLVSIGYSACHWCHVMAHESFEDASTAEVMNAHFVNVKVDREERPDVDQIYMDTVVKLTGHGGWPLTVFCRPDGRPFYAGTYYPDAPRGGMPSFKQVLTSIDDAWRNQRNEIDHSAEQIVEALDARLPGAPDGTAGALHVVTAARELMKLADRYNGGFGEQGAKFPTPTNLELLLASLDFLPENEAADTCDHVARTCAEMSRRGLYDHLGGGFHRYCVDPAWAIPHFEKMLYDQGLLLRVYAETWRRLQGPADLVWPMRETARYLAREMTPDEGGFFASQDADSEGVEGKFYVWTPSETRAVLGDDAAAFDAAYGVTPMGNFEGRTTHLQDMARGEREQHAEARAALLAERAKRIPPATDTKRVAAWNAYAISGLARAGSLLADATLLTQADDAARFVLDRMVDDQGRLHRVFNEGQASVPAFLDDHAATLEACLELHRAGAGPRYLETALHFAEQITDRFFDDGVGDLFFTPSDGEALAHRPRSDHDGATPAAAGQAVLGLLRLAGLSGWAQFALIADQVIHAYGVELERAPHAYPTLMRAVALRARGLSVAVILGDPSDGRTEALAVRARRVLLPEDGVVIAPPAAEPPRGLDPSWLAGREAQNGEPTAYVCRGTTCSLPVTDPDLLEPLEGRL